MNNILKTVALASVVAALAACAQKPNQDKPALTATAKTDGLDVFQDKSAPFILKEKYKTLSATCKLTAVETTLPQAEVLPPNAVAVSAEGTDPGATPPPPPPVPQPVVEGLNLSYDLKAQAAADADLKKVLKATMKSADEKTIFSLFLKPLEFIPNSSEKVGPIIRLRKHSPRLAILVSVNDATDDLSKTINPAVVILLNESAPLDTVVRTSTTGNVRTDLVMGCTLAGEMAKPEYKNQNLDLDCSKEPTEELKAVYKANCPIVSNPPQPAPIQ